MLTKHTVRWASSKNDGQIFTTVYFSPTHHDFRKHAEAKNETEAKNRADYDDACAMGRATIVEHVREPYGEA